MPSNESIPKRPLGKTGELVSIIGLGGYHLAKFKDEKTAIKAVRDALEAGITFLDNAWEYHDGKSEEWMGKALADGWREKAFLMTKVCSHGRDRKVAMQQLEDSLRRLKTDRLDLWQIHEVVYHNDPDLHFAKDGAVEALEQAKREGKVRFAGFTGHKDPSIHLDMLSRGFAFDACQMPLNVFDSTFRSFEQQVLPEVNRQGIAALGMKTMCGDGGPLRKNAVTADEALRYAMSLPVAVTITGIDSQAVLEHHLRIARGFEPMTDSEMDALRRKCAPHAADGRFELFKISMKHEGPIGRKQHGVPPEDEVAA